MNIVVLLGGSSVERQVSYSSGIAIYASLKQANHQVTAIDPAIDRDNCDDAYFAAFEYKTASYRDHHNPLHLEKLNNHLERIKREINPDIVFIALHGGYGEDGTVQEKMDNLGLKYTGSGAAASKIAMNKNESKQLMLIHQIATADWQIVNQNNIDESAILERFSLPLIVKTNQGGSSVGLTIVHHKAELKSALDKAFAIEGDVMLEEYIDGREITISILNGKCYPPIEIKPKHEYYDYDCKYTKGMTEYIVPAVLHDDLLEKINRSALKCFEILGLQVYGRIDFLLKTDDSYYCLEANSLPGMTETSLIPKSMSFAGLNFDQIVTEILNHSLEK